MSSKNVQSLWPVSCNGLDKKFHSLGPSTENARRPHEFRRYDGTTSWWPAAERTGMDGRHPPEDGIRS